MLTVVEGIERVPARHAIVLLHAVGWFSDRPDAVRVLCDVVLRRGDVPSLRSIDAFVTKTCRFTPHLSHVFDDYRRHLSSFSKRLFDPFARRDRITLLAGTVTISTTVGQINFIRWFIEAGVGERMRQEDVGFSKEPRVAVAGFAC